MAAIGSLMKTGCCRTCCTRAHSCTLQAHEDTGGIPGVTQQTQIVPGQSMIPDPVGGSRQDKGRGHQVAYPTRWRSLALLTRALSCLVAPAVAPLPSPFPAPLTPTACCLPADARCISSSTPSRLDRSGRARGFRPACMHHPTRPMHRQDLHAVHCCMIWYH